MAHWVSGELGRRLFARLRNDADLSSIFGPDFKILASLEVEPGEARVEWRRMILSVQHVPKLPYERQHRILLPLLEQILRDLETGELAGAASTFTSDKLLLNGAGEFAIGGPEGDNGLSGKKLVIDHYGPGVPIGGGALAGKDPHKVDKCGALRPASWPKSSFADESTRLASLWAGRRGVIRRSSSRHRRPLEVSACRCRGRNCHRMNGSPSSQSFATWNFMKEIGWVICWEATSAKPPLPGSDEDRCNHEESDSIPRCSIPYSIRSHNLRRILIALCAVIAEMAFLRQTGRIFLQMIVIRGVRLHIIRYLPS